MRLGYQKISNIKVENPEKVQAIQDVREIYKVLRFYAEALRTSYDILISEPYELRDRYFNFDDEGNCEEVSFEEYRGSKGETEDETDGN